MASNAHIRTGRLSQEELEENFADLHPPLSRSEALIEADRCYFCFDAPCTTACPTGIDIPGFIQKIRSDNLRGSANTILSENIIGLLQRYSTDPVFASGDQLFERAPSSGKTIAIVGGGPAGLSCAHRLAVLGHDVVVFNRDSKLGGLNEYGIAAYKAINDFAQTEVDYILSIGGIEVRCNSTLGSDIELDELRQNYDAVFLGIGLAQSNNLGIAGEDLDGVFNAIEYISELRQAEDKSRLPVGSDVVVIGGGMTAIDVAVQSKRLGAEQVHIVYRRGPEQMSASVFEQALAQTSGVTIHHWASPARILGADHVTGVEFDTDSSEDGMRLAADVVFKAIGQRMDSSGIEEIATESGRFVVDIHQKTSLDGVWAGGDCVVGGDDLTVSAVQHGKIAALSIDQYLRDA
jgi:glutamate synthase (NADPH/NADH) small chain